jgi:hypothetical protein
LSEQPQPRLLRAVIGSAAVASYQMFVRQGLMLRTILSSSVADTSCDIGPDLGWLNVLRFKSIYFARYLMRQQTLWEDGLSRLQSETLSRLKSQNAPKNLVLPIPEVQPNEVDPERFYRDFVVQGRPVVIRGGAKSLDAFRKWDVSWFKRYANDNVWIANRDTGANHYGPLGEVLNAPSEGRRLYLYASTDLLRDHPELVADLDIPRFRSMMSRNPIGHVGSQLFLGTDKGSGSGWHCAGGHNLFLQLRGRKRWRFVHPDQMWTLYPLMQTTFQNMLSVMTPLQGKDVPPEWAEEHIPLFAYCQQREVELEPGDILFNPAWTWHTVENLTDETVAVASRWVPPITVSYNRFAELGMLFSKAVWKRRFQALRDGRLALSDDDMRAHTPTIDHRVDFGSPGAYNRMLQKYKLEAILGGGGLSAAGGD